MQLFCWATLVCGHFFFWQWALCYECSCLQAIFFFFVCIEVIPSVAKFFHRLISADAELLILLIDFVFVSLGLIILVLGKVGFGGCP